MAKGRSGDIADWLEFFGLDRLPDERPDYMPEREWRVLTDRAAAKTLRDIGTELGVTPSRVRQIEGNALRRMSRAIGRQRRGEKASE